MIAVKKFHSFITVNKMHLVHPLNKVVSTKAEAVDVEKLSEIREHVKLMAPFMIEHRGIGLAAPQVGIPLRFFITKMNPEDDLRIFINPEIVTLGEEITEMNEGCLTLPEQMVPVKRPSIVTIKYTDLNGNVIEETFDGLMAKCVQHEYDHLDGILLTDKVSKMKKTQILKKVEKIIRN